MKFSDVTFAYPSRPNIQILNQFCLNVPSGSVTAIVGILFFIIKRKKPFSTTLLSDICDRRKPCSLTIYGQMVKTHSCYICQNGLNAKIGAGKICWDGTIAKIIMTLQWTWYVEHILTIGQYEHVQKVNSLRATPQNCQTHTNNSSENCFKVFDHFMGLVLKGLTQA